MAGKYPMVTTPCGVFIYPHLTEADTKFVKPDGEYHTKFALEADDKATKEFAAELTRYMEEYIDLNTEELKPAQLKKALRADLFEEEMDDEGEETGRLIFKFKLKAKVETKTKSWDQRPRLFDSAAEAIKGKVNIWTGSEGKVNVEVFPYYMATTKSFGLSLRCVGVQILKLVEGSGGPDAASMGFGAEDDGYVANDSGFDDESDDVGGEGSSDDEEF